MRFALLAAVLAIGCSKKNPDGMPPASDWGSSGQAGEPSTDEPRPANPHAGMGGMGADPANPYAGVAGMGADTSNPHAGLDMPDPHGGGTDVSKLGLPAPDPNRAMDPQHHITGIIKVDPKVKDRVVPGAAVFLIVKRAGADGQPTGSPLAVDKTTWAKQESLPFSLSEQQAMVAGTELTGDVVVIARYDHDGDAISKEPGDVVGQVRVKIPADNVVLSLETVLP